MSSVYKFVKTFLLLLVFASSVFAGTTGKLKGYVTDKQTGEVILGANIIIEGTYFGAASDLDGYYYINNIPPGNYRVIVSAIGYRKVIVENISIRIDLTTNVDVELSSTIIEMEDEVVVTSTRPLVQKDLTSTSVTISSDEIRMMPVENVDQIVNLQAGVIGGHFRGGRSNDVSYLIDGVAVNDVYNGERGLEVENSSIRQMEVITGTFNAEYGQALSGVVNIVTQSGSNSFHGTATGFAGNYFSSNDQIFKNLDNLDNLATKNFEFSLSGPVFDKLTFFLTGRYFENSGFLYGQRFYNVTDSDFLLPTGDAAYVSMNPYEKYSFNGKLTYSLQNINFSYGLFYDDNSNRYYDHFFSWTPDGVMNHYRNNLLHNFQINHYPSQSTYQTFKFSINLQDYEGYLYEDEFDPRYVNPNQGLTTSDYTFRTGGNQTGRYKRYTNTYIGQWTISSQVSKEHKLQFGAEGRYHDIFNHNRDLINLTDGQVDSLLNPIFTPGYPNVGTITDQGENIRYNKQPFEISAYIQDKMEYDIMIINAGLRFEYFDPQSQLPVDLRNPRNNRSFPGANQYVDASPKYQFSPRLGVSFPITDKGILRFSYGHFFKIPNFENLYRNPDFIVNPGNSLNQITGNPDLGPESTIMYELGLQQILFPNFALDLTLYYRDIRNWLGMEIINTYEGFKYARFVNRDYANVYGLIVTLDKRFADYFGLKIDYTYQVAEGNASDPQAVYNNNQTSPPIEENKTVVSLDWDQRHTLNVQLNVGNPGDWLVGFIYRYGSGWPYTEDVKISKGVRFENGGIKPSWNSVDLKVEKIFRVGNVNVSAFLWVYNLLDILNEEDVYSTTGRANVDLNTQIAGDIIGLNSIDQYVNNPDFYSTPREIRLGLTFGF
ncbi:TonB-dependent receptor domain-containing protein [Bacteroidota bacterium]